MWLIEETTVRLWQKQTRTKPERNLKKINHHGNSFQTVLLQEIICVCIKRLFDHFLMCIDRTLDVYFYF